MTTPRENKTKECILILFEESMYPNYTKYIPRSICVAHIKAPGTPNEYFII